MKRRWIIRSFFIGLMLFFAGAWARTFFYQYKLCYHSKDDYRLYRAIVGEGRFTLYAEPARVHLDGFFDGWEFWESKIGDAYRPEAEDCQLLGFGIDYRTDMAKFRDHLWLVVIPLYFPTALSAGLLWFAWRKTRPKAERRAFPVEVPAKDKPP